jgi:uncharacterized protein
LIAESAVLNGRLTPRHRRAEWPYTLDVDAVRAAGWVPTPFRQFILKIHGRCDLACDYCYMYRGPDQSWRDQPVAMSREVVETVARRIAEHAHAHGTTGLDIVLHGGEPLLAGPELISFVVKTIKAAAGADITVRTSIQTNGVRLTERYLKVLDALGVRVGVSLDGDGAAHDRHRRRPDGRGSHAQVLRAVRRLSADSHRHLFAGLLCTIDLRNDPVATYEELLAFRPPAVDFLLPHGNWRSPPPGREEGGIPATPYADWLTAVFDRWYGAAVRPAGVRILDEIVTMLLGGRGGTEGLGLAPAACLVIETDGAIGQDDALRTAYPGATWTGLHVSRDPLDRALLLPPFVARQLGADALPAGCRSCDLRQVCGGGYYPHRYRPGSGFANPTVYCPDLYALIDRVRDRLAADVAGLVAAHRTRR